MHTVNHVVKPVVLLAAALTCGSMHAEDEYEGWNLEPGLSEAQLVVVARVSSISRVTVVEGAKTDVALREYRFQPVRRLKGLFQRDELSMTATDLGFTGEDGAAPPLREGEYRLLILAQQRGTQNMGCVSAPPGASGFEERVPLLAGPDDPLVGTVETLIRVVDSRSRRERATLLLDRLGAVGGRAAVPLLTSLLLRADWAAADERAYASVTPLTADALRAARGAALDLLRDMLASGDVPEDPQQLAGVAAALRAVLESDEPDTRLRLAALEALGQLVELQRDLDWPRELLIGQLTSAATHAERAAAATALAGVEHPQAVAAVLDALAALPLDEAADREQVYARAAARLDRAGAERVLIERFERSLAARQSLEGEIIQLGRMRSGASVPLMLTAAGRPSAGQNDHYYLAWALGRTGDDRAIPVLVGWLRAGESFEVALAALEAIDSEAAAREVRPLLKSQRYLQYKLRIARLLARHGFADGYALATEHLADSDHLPAAALLLAALNDARTKPELSAILNARPDRRWRLAALAGLAAVDDADAKRQLLAILTDERDPLAAEAAEAAGLTAGSELLRPLAGLVESRNRQIALAALTALRRSLTGVRSSPLGLEPAAPRFQPWQSAFLIDDELSPTLAVLPADTRSKLAAAVAAIAADPYVDALVRSQAFAVARLLQGEGYARLLDDLADQPELERQDPAMLKDVRAERRRLARLASPS